MQLKISDATILEGDILIQLFVTLPSIFDSLIKALQNIEKCCERNITI